MVDVLRARIGRVAWALVLVELFGFGPVTGLAAAQDDSEATARLLEQRLHAPCCREQLLDGHESDLARGLRQEIRTRLRAGESAGAVEAELVQRYGQSIVAIPADRDPREGLSVLLIVSMSLAAFGLLVLGLRWVRRSRALPGVPATTGESTVADALDAKLDRELRQLDR